MLVALPRSAGGGRRVKPTVSSSSSSSSSSDGVEIENYFLFPLSADPDIPEKRCSWLLPYMVMIQRREKAGD